MSAWANLNLADASNEQSKKAMNLNFAYDWDPRVDLIFGEHNYDPNKIKYYQNTISDFVIWDEAEIALETAYHATMIASYNILNKEIDTIIYLFQKQSTNDPSWTLLASNDNYANSFFSHLTMKLEAGQYRVVISRKNTNLQFPKDYMPMVDLKGKCQGVGCKPPQEPARTCNLNDDWDCLIGDAVNDSRLTMEVGINNLPQHVLNTVHESIEAINKKSFPDTDYSAHFSAIYAIFQDTNKTEVVAYAVVGYGYGEPDYNEEIIYGIDLEGNLVYENTINW